MIDELFSYDFRNMIAPNRCS